MWGFMEGTCEGKLVLFKTCQSVEGHKSKCSSMSPANCLTKGSCFELIHTYSFPIECHVQHYLAKQSFELTEFPRWLPHLSWTSVTNYTAKNM